MERHLRPRTWMLATAAILLSTATYAQTPAAGLDRSRVWFTPSLTENHDALCPTVLEAARGIFISGQPFISRVESERKPFGPLEHVPLEALATEPRLEGGKPVAETDTSSFIEVEGRKLYLKTRTFPGCGGGCEAESLQVSEQQIGWYVDVDPKDKSKLAATPAAITWLLYRDTRGAYFTIGEVDDTLQVYRVVKPEAWKLSCSVALAPTSRDPSDADLERARTSVGSLSAAVGPIEGGYGYCGTLKAGENRSIRLREALYQTLYRPWALRGSMPDFGGWAAQGTLEFRAEQAFRAQLETTTRELAGFYAKKTGWSPQDSLTLARQALDGALSTGFAFRQYSPFLHPDELRTRVAILERRPIEEIAGIAPDVRGFDRPGADSVLNVAIEYPEALRSLLDRGANPNQANAFGKTPLMYAAQYNQLESARILLEHGADPNAGTFRPDDGCTYTLTRFKVTPLHYAARYASLDLIRLLVNGGAVTFSEAETDSEGPYPVDWLSTFTSQRREDSELLELLRVPDEATRADLSERSTKLAESEYSKGRTQQAYRALKTALLANPRNARARSNLALVAMRTGRLGEAAEAAHATFTQEKSAAARAGALFNMGLVCEQHYQKDNGYLEYNGEYYCRAPPMHAFLQAWKLDPTAARRAKIEQTFVSPPASKRPDGVKCNVTTADAKTQRYRFAITSDDDVAESSLKQRIYAYHPAATVIDPASIRWDVTYYRNGQGTKGFASPRVIERHDFKSFAVTELASDQYIQGPLAIGSSSCPDPRLR